MPDDVTSVSSPPQLILFDAVHTLIEPDPPVVAVYQRIGEQHGLRLEENDLRARFVVAMTNANLLLRQTKWNWQTDEDRELEFWQTVVRNVFAELPPGAAESAFQQLWKHFAQVQHWRVFDDVAPTLAELRRRGYRCGIGSNFDQRLTGICAVHPVLSVFDPIFVSSRVGWSKPAAKFYRTIEKLTGLLPELILIVGDDFENDVQAPSELGWQTRWLRRDGSEDLAGHLSSLLALLTILS